MCFNRIRRHLSKQRSENYERYDFFCVFVCSGSFNVIYLWTKRCFFTTRSAELKRDFQDVYPKNLLALFYKLSKYCMLTFNTCLTYLLTLKGNLWIFLIVCDSYQARIIQVVSIRSSLIREKQIPFTLAFTCHDVRSCDRGCLENSDLETSDLRPRKLRPRNFRPLEKRLKL